MLKFFAKLFATETTATRTAPNTTARLSLNAMEDRYAPAGITNPGTIRGFNPQPEPPLNPAATRTIIAIQPAASGAIPTDQFATGGTAGEANGIIAITQPATARGFIIEGGH